MDLRTYERSLRLLTGHERNGVAERTAWSDWRGGSLSVRGPIYLHCPHAIARSDTENGAMVLRVNALAITSARQWEIFASTYAPARGQSYLYS